LKKVSGRASGGNGRSVSFSYGEKTSVSFSYFLPQGWQRPEKTNFRAGKPPCKDGPEFRQNRARAIAPALLLLPLTGP
jgi:hypothetical protein